MDLNGRTRRDPFPDRQPVDYVLGVARYGDPQQLRRQQRRIFILERLLIVSIAALAAGAFAWVLS
jgi:hypothetical protein